MGQSYCSQRWANPAWPKGSKSRGFSNAEEYILFPENIGADLSLDETCLSNGEVYTLLTNKARMDVRVRWWP